MFYDKWLKVKSKITLYSDKELIEQIKQYAKENKTSVSQLVNNIFKAILLNKKSNKNLKKSKITDSLEGILKDSKIDIDDYKNYLEKKYL